MNKLLAACCLSLAGCASTTITGAVPFCPGKNEALPVRVFWEPHWRNNQKEPASREELARLGIEDFFRSSTCFRAVEISKKDLSVPPGPGPALLIAVRELGPVVRICASPALLEGGTEVRLEIELVRDGQRRQQSLHWQNGGPFVIKNTSTLRADMTSALAAGLESP